MDAAAADRAALAGRTILAVLAHPDDESLACGGTLARAADAGARVVLVCGSRGERGSISDPALLGDRPLSDVRHDELIEAATVLGISKVIALSHPDGDLRWDHVPQFHADIVRAVEEQRPDAVITFDEDGLYWHLDHIGVHERTYTAVKSFGEAAPPLYYATMPHGVMGEIVDAARRKSGAPADSSFWGIEPDAFGDFAKPPDFVVDVAAWIPRKLAALRCHRTQMGLRNPFAWIDEPEGRRWLSIEQYRRSPLPTSLPYILEALAAGPAAPETQAR